MDNWPIAVDFFFFFSGKGVIKLDSLIDDAVTYPTTFQLDC